MGRVVKNKRAAAPEPSKKSPQLLSKAPHMARTQVISQGKTHSGAMEFEVYVFSDFSKSGWILGRRFFQLLEK